MSVDVELVRNYLGTPGVSIEELQRTLDVERRAQARVTVVENVVDSDSLDDLAEALCRRVARNLAMRGIPLAVQVGELGPVRVGKFDPEIARLEGPFLRSERPAIG